MTWKERQGVYSRTPRYYNEANPLGLELPDKGGLYLIGNTAFNPNTQEKQFWVKVGQASNLYDTFRKRYRCTNPCVFNIDFYTSDPQHIHINESACHEKLLTVCEALRAGTEEWFLVSEQIYMEICKYKFAYFNLY